LAVLRAGHQASSSPMGAACARPEPPSPAEATVAPAASCALGLAAGEGVGSDAGGFRCSFEVELEEGWVPFDARVAAKFAEAELRGQQRVDYSARRQSYVVDLHAMQQVNVRSGVSRRIRRVGSEEVPPAFDRHHRSLHVLHETRAPSHTDIPRRTAVCTPAFPGSLPELLQLGEPELGRLRGTHAALDEFIMSGPQARHLVSQAAAATEENLRLQKAAAAKLGFRAQQADGEAEAFLQEALDLPGSMDPSAVAHFREQYLHQKMQKQKSLLAKKRLDNTEAEWRAYCLTPGAARGPF